MADGINLIDRYADDHFEAAKFLFDLGRALRRDQDGSRPRRA